MTAEYTLIVVGPLVELQMLTVSELPSAGGSAVILATERTIGCDAPIVAATVAMGGWKVGIAANSISASESNPITDWCTRYGIEGLSFIKSQNPAIIGLDSIAGRKRLYLTPNELNLSEPRILKSGAKFIYLDWYPEVRSWFDPSQIDQLATQARLWVNLARHYDDSSLESLSGTSPEVVQVSLREREEDTERVVSRLFDTTNVRMIITTFGSGGSAIHSRDGKRFEEAPCRPLRESRSGAGAVFIGILMSSIMENLAWEKAHRRAVDVANDFVGHSHLDQVPDLSL